MALTDKLNDGEIIIKGGLEKIKGKTKQLAKIIEKLKSPAFGSGYSTRPIRPCSKPDPTAGKQKSKITIVLSKIEENIIRAGKNIPYLEFLQAKQLNTYQVLNGGLLVFTQESLKGLEEILLEKK
jgi:ribosomal protein L4